MPKAITTFECQICGAEFATENEAILCEQQEFAPKFKAGDIVTVGKGFGWYDGDKLWVSNPNIELRPDVCPNRHGNCFNECCTYQFYYVVTYVDCEQRTSHRPRYHLATGAMSGKQGYRYGYTYDWGHIPPKLVANASPELREAGKTLIGHQASILL